MDESSAGKSGLSSFAVLFFALFFAADIFVWHQIFYGKYPDKAEIRFLDVGQGDSELIIFPGNIKILTDAGPDSKVVRELEKIPQLGDKYIDVAVISHPQTDHFGGFGYLADRYRIGTFIYNGRNDSPGVAEWSDLLGKIKNKKIPMIKLAEGDSIKYAGSVIDFLSPGAELVQSVELNDTGLIEMINSGDLKALFAADIGAPTENYLMKHYNLAADVLKVAHHGSKYSSSRAFIEAVSPKIAVIEVGARNSYGHPADATLKKLADLAPVFRTDKNGQITVAAADGKLKIFTSK